MNDSLKEYRDKVASGEIIRAKPLNPRQKHEKNPRSLRLAINAQCWECVGENKAEVTRCTGYNCSLWGVRPWQKKPDLPEGER